MGAVWDLPEGCGHWLGVAWERLPPDFGLRNACLLAQNPLMKTYALCIEGLDHPPNAFKDLEEQADSCSPWEGRGKECLRAYALLRFGMTYLCPVDLLRTDPAYLFLGLIYNTEEGRGEVTKRCCQDVQLKTSISYVRGARPNLCSAVCERLQRNEEPVSCSVGLGPGPSRAK